ncbi:MAG TPA: response regulator [Candidatus Acidoferrum sp.]
MAKILVADDNSNIQRMVLLALKDQGIDVVAVGNGEAAVRKISDVKPDLVLADIFMPVRNGYEVCKFVKDDAALSHIPVILLVGAFDPLDEQEAQRVGADGVLKKPFVPPDPLISMVKSSLARAGVTLGATSTPPPPMPEAAKPAARQEPPPLPRVVPPPAVFAREREEDSGTPVFSVPHSVPLAIEKNAQPLAFGNLLDTTAPEDDGVFAISPKTDIAPDRDWGSSTAKEEQEETEDVSQTGGWRVSSSMEETVDQTPAGQTDWREAAFSGIGIEKTHGAGWAPSVEKNSLAITEEEAAALARERESFPASGASHGAEDWSKAIAEVFPAKQESHNETELTKGYDPLSSVVPAASEAIFASVPPPPIVSEGPQSVQAEIVARSEQPGPNSAINSWMAGAVSPWDSELLRTSQLASAWDTAKGTPAVAVEETSAAEASQNSELVATSTTSFADELKQGEHKEEETSAFEPATEEILPAAPATETPLAESLSGLDSMLSPITKEILKEETTHGIAEQEPEAEKRADAVAIAASAPEVVMAPNMDEIVAKVLAKMNPEVLQAVTREILKPLLGAMIQEELQKK